MSFDSPCDKWYNEIDRLNTAMRRIRKTQNQCKMLDVATREQSKTFNAILFEKSETDKLFNYKIYIPELKLTGNLKTDKDFENYTEKEVKIYVFHDEKRLKRKIRFQLT